MNMEKDKAPVYFNEYELDLLQRLSLKEELTFINETNVTITDSFYYKYKMEFTEKEMSMIMFAANKNEEFKCLKPKLQTVGESNFGW